MSRAAQVWRTAASLLLGAAVLAPAAETPPARVMLTTTNDLRREVLLVGRAANGRILYRLPNQPAGVSASLNPAEFSDAEFVVTNDDARAFAVYAAARQRQYVPAAQTSLVAFASARPFLDLPENNAAEPVLQAGMHLGRAAEAWDRLGAANTNAAANARKLRELALAVFQDAARADWCPVGDLAKARRAMCLTDLGRLDEAELALRAIRAPDVGDAVWGVYWLAQGRLLLQQGKTPAALDAAIQSLAYENKDLQTFPDALMLAARCYEDLNEIHRTRDVYYELARLFRGTEWGEEARRRLKVIMTNNLTRKEEPANIAGVFFGSQEDMNRLCDDYLQATEPAAMDAAAPEAQP